VLAPSEFRRATDEITDSRVLEQSVGLIDALRYEMESEMASIRERSLAYLRWYSPPFNERLGAHDAWNTPISPDDIGTSRTTITIPRAVVDIYASLEAAAAVRVRAEPERLPPMLPSVDQNEQQVRQTFYAWRRSVESWKSDLRSARMRQFLKRDDFDVKQFFAVRKKNLHGFAWTKMLPNLDRKVVESYVVRDPTNVYPMWSSRTPGELDAILCVQLVGARLANQRYGLGLEFERDGMTVMFAPGLDQGNYHDLNDRYFDSTRKMVWVEELWWIDRDYDRMGKDGPRTCVYCVVRVAGKPYKAYRYEGWRHIPFVYWENSDERDWIGWSDVANVMDIADEINRRYSQQGDTIGMYSSPRFQVLGTIPGRDISMPGPFQKIDLQDAERIEQILTRIDTYPTDRHFDMSMELLHRATGLPPIVWGLINNAQTSGRALSASWKATETRLSPKLMSNRMSVQRHCSIIQSLAAHYDWYNGRDLWRTNDEDTFEDWRFEFPPMEPRDFMEVTQDAINKRDAGLITTIMAMRLTGDEAAEETLQEVLAERMNVLLQPTFVQQFLLAQRTQLDNAAYAQQVMGQQQQGQPFNTGTVAQMMGQASQAQQAGMAPPGGAQEGTLPATQANAPGNMGTTAPPQVQTSTMVQNGEVSNRQIIQA